MKTYNLTWGNNTPHTQRLLGQLILYVAQKTKDFDNFGAVKLNKVLYHADMEMFRKTGKAITGAQYQRLDNGPVARHLLQVEADLIDNGKLEIMKLPGSIKKRIAKAKPDLSDFTQEQLAEIDAQIARLKDMTAVEVSEDSHDTRWHATRDKAGVPYEFAFLSGTATERDIADAKSYAEELGW